MIRNELGVMVFGVVFLTFVVSNCRGNLVIMNEDMDKMLEYSKIPPHCRVHANKDIIMFVYESRRDRVRVVPNDQFNYMMRKCDEDILTFFERRMKFIYPGTNWCGPGDIAKNDSDLGPHEVEDSCCRKHDKCPKALESGECSNGICNDSKYTRSHCDCDVEFQKCLRDANTETANTIGAIFFNIVQVICFKEEDDCKESDKAKCPLKFVESNAYSAPAAPYKSRNKKAFYLNKFLRSLRLVK